MAERRLHVLHLVGTSHAGGTERFLADLAARHTADGIRTSIVVLDAPGPLADDYRRAAADVEHLEAGAGRLRAVRRWRAAAGRLAPDVIVAYGTRANLLARLAAPPGGAVPVIAALRSTVPDEQGRPVSRWLDRLTFGRLAACVSNSRAALSVLTSNGYPDHRLAYIPPGIDWPEVGPEERAAARAAFGLAEEDLVVLSVGNLKPVKQQALLLHASSRLVRRGVAHRLWIVGEGPERPRLEALARELGLDAELTGFEASPRRRYAAADAFILTSRWEGAPMSILEAMAAGLPVVAPAVGDVAAIVKDGETGRLVRTPDAGTFAAALADALGPSTRQAWRQAARERSRLFSAAAAAGRYATLFRWAAARTGGALPASVVPVRPVRILRVLSRLNVGGPTLQVVLLSEAMNDDRFETCLVAGTVGPEEGDMSYVAAERGVPVHAIPELGRSVAPLRDFTALVRLVRLIRRFRPDIVHTHASKAGALGRLAAIAAGAGRPRGRRILIVHTYHGHTFEGYFSRVPALLFRAVERALARWTDIVIVLSESQREDIVTRFAIAPPGRVRIVPLGLDLRACLAVTPAEASAARGRLGLLPGEQAIVGAGRLAPIKNFALLVDAFGELVRRRPLTRLFFAGDGEERAALEARVAGLGLASRVTFLGWRREMAEVYAACDVVALTSRNEGTPVALIEGIAAGCRAVATNVGGVASVVDESCGILVSAGPAAPFGDALERALDAGRLGTAARLRMRTFSFERLVCDLRELYGAELARRGESGA